MPVERRQEFLVGSAPHERFELPLQGPLPSGALLLQPLTAHWTRLLLRRLEQLQELVLRPVELRRVPRSPPSAAS